MRTHYTCLNSQRNLIEFLGCASKEKKKIKPVEDELKISYQSEDTGKSMAMMDAYTHTHSSLHIHTLYPCTPYNNKKLTVAPKIKKK